MDIFSFVNSKDIREYLRKIEYQFNSLEAAWLIYWCHHLTYEEKKTAWKQVISTMSDCEIPKQMNHLAVKGIHAVMERYMTIVDEAVADFIKESKEHRYVYMYSCLYKDGEDENSWEENYQTIYGSLDACMSAYQISVETDAENEDESGENGIIKYRIRRQELDYPELVSEMEYNGKGQLLNIVKYHTENEMDNDILNYFYEALWLDFPTPFAKGDILWIPSKENKLGCDSGAFVLDNMATWNPVEGLENWGDYSDMCGWGYFVNPNGTVYYESVCNYMELEYYQGPYKLIEKILCPLSYYVQKKIEVDLLLCAYRKVLLDVEADDIMLKSWYPKEMLKELDLFTE